MRENKTANFLMECGICGYLLTVLFNGYLMHLGLSIDLIQILRPYIPEFFMMLVILAWLITKPKLLTVDLQYWVYILIVCALSVGSINSVNSVLAVVRDFFEPMIMLSIISVYGFSHRERTRVLSLILYIFTFFVVVGCYFAIHQKIMGESWTGVYFAGYTFWGVDTVASVRLSSGWLGFKALGTVGSAETFGFYNAFVIIYLLYYGYRYKMVNVALIVVAVVNVLCSGMKTPLLMILVILFAAVFFPNRKKMDVFGRLSVVVVAMVIFLCMIADGGDWTETSMYARLMNWQELLQGEHWINLLVPQNLFGYSSGAGNSGVTGFWDNAYFYVAFSTGFVGLFLFIRCLLARYRLIESTEQNKFMAYSLLFLAMSSITTCVFFGRNVITTMFMVFGIHTAVAIRGAKNDA